MDSGNFRAQVNSHFQATSKSINRINAAEVFIRWLKSRVKEMKNINSSRVKRNYAHFVLACHCFFCTPSRLRFPAFTTAIAFTNSCAHHNPNGFAFGKHFPNSSSIHNANA